jgi:hypothetical protein
MKVEEIIEQLREEHVLISIAIARLEAVAALRSLSAEVPKRRGRPRGSKNKPRFSKPGNGSKSSEPEN